jgi:hypothetical protein
MSKSAKARSVAAPRSPYLDRPHDVPAAIGPLSPKFRDYLASVRAHYDAHDKQEPRFGSPRLPATRQREGASTFRKIRAPEREARLPPCLRGYIRRAILR